MSINLINAAMQSYFKKNPQTGGNRIAELSSDEKVLVLIDKTIEDIHLKLSQDQRLRSCLIVDIMIPPQETGHLAKRPF